MFIPELNKPQKYWNDRLEQSEELYFEIHHSHGALRTPERLGFHK